MLGLKSSHVSKRGHRDLPCVYVHISILMSDVPATCNFNGCVMTVGGRIEGCWSFCFCYYRQDTEQTVDLMVAKVTMVLTQMHCNGSILSNDSLAPRGSGCGFKNAKIIAALFICETYRRSSAAVLSCGGTCQIWVWFTAFNRYICKIGNFAYGEIRERSLSKPQPRTYDNDPTWSPKDLTDMISAVVRVMIWCCQAAGHCLNQCGPGSMSPWRFWAIQS